MPPTCPYCKKGKTITRGYRKIKKGTLIQRQCNKCGKYSHDKVITKMASKILLLDIETSLMEFYGYSPYIGYVRSTNVIKDWSIICWTAKWLFGSEVMQGVVTPQEAVLRQDHSIMAKLWKLMDEADIIVHQNGKKFDIPKINWRLLLAGYPPPSHYSQVDTKEVLKKNFGASYNSQEWVTKTFGIQQKDEMHFEDWIKCIEGSTKTRKIALQKMVDYNRNDVVGLEEMYLRLRPWIPAHANLGIYTDSGKDCCPNCESTELKWGDQYATPLGLYEAFRCMSCGAIGRSTKKKYRIKSVDVRG